MTKARLLPIVFVVMGLACQPAAAAQIYSEITLDQLATVLATGFQVDQAQTKNGVRFLILTGKENIIAAFASHCGDDLTCEGVEFFTVAERKYSLAQTNEFNAAHSYSKMLLRPDGSISLRIEIFTVGGVSDENIVNNAAMLMLREDEANSAGVVASLKAPGGPTVKLGLKTSISQLLAAKAATGGQAKRPDPARVEVLRKHFEERLASWPAPPR